MGEGKPGIRSRERGIQPDRALEISLCLVVILTCESVHMPQPAMVYLPGGQRIRRRKHSAIALGNRYFAVERADYLGRYVAKHVENSCKLTLVGVRPDHTT